MVLITHWHILKTMLFCLSVKASENISVNKTSSQSTSWKDNPSSLAVDGIKDCSNKFTHTNENETSAWWQVNLGDVYEIKRIGIYYRTSGYTHRLNGYSIEIALNDPSYQDAWQCYKDFDISQLPSSTPSHICRRLGQYVKLYVERLAGLTYNGYDGKGAVINLCEFEVFGCLRGRYGNGNCASTCSTGCLDSRCDPDNGNCNCTAGWKGDKCDTRSCGNGYYGDSCLPCPNGCIGYCNTINGHCSYGCKDSFYGDLCDKSCPVNCKNTRCNQSTGYCMEGCDSLHYIGNKCNDCVNGYYGDLCLPCPNGCIGYCNTINGHCTGGCKDSFYGDLCDKSCPVNCKNKRCHKISGDCVDGCQSSLFTGYKCNDCVNGYYGNSCSPCPKGCIGYCNTINGHCTGGCKDSFYGDLCDKSCPVNCKNSRCQQSTGYCSEGCKSLLFKGYKCNDCVNGYYGDFCLPCPNGCNGYCNTKNGHCTGGCKDSFYGDLCDKFCPVNCKNKRCHQSNGNCMEDCKTTFFIGNKCKDCANGYYGDSCLPCPNGCNGYCSAVNGNCTHGCKDSFFGNLCDKSCPVNCKNGRCYKNTGDCIDGCNTTSFMGNKCKGLQSDSQSGSGSAKPQNTKGPNIGAIIGGVIATIVAILSVVVILLFLKRRRHNSCKETGYENQIVFAAPKTTKGSSRDNVKQEKRKSNHTDTNNKETIVSIESGDEYSNSPDVYMNLSLTEVPVSELGIIISKKAAEKEFSSEYDKLPKGTKHPTNVGKHPDNKIKNRFLTTFPYDHSRVILKPISAQQKSDYINANYIDGVEIRHSYIATQGPKTNTLLDFWKMVWQEESGKIVMLTNLIENEKPKCEQYWPNIGQEKDFGPFKVTTGSEKESAFFFERTFQLTNKKTKETRQILQYHFTMWPDHGTPDPVQLMLFHRKVKEAKTTLPGPPIIHCAAGIGRTGTFIALDTLHDYGDKTGRIDIFEYVIRMRKDRMNMIQTLEQYVVLHEALFESFQYTGRSLSRNKFLEVCNELNEAKPKNQTNTFKEFQKLSAMRPVFGIESYDSALETNNRRKSRNQNILAVEKYRPFLMSQHSSRTNFINAVMLPTFRKKCGYFVTHYPLENTVVDFWCMVFDHDSSTIVVLDEISDKDNVLHWYPDDETEMTVDSFQIKKVSEPHIYGRVREIEFTVTHQDDEKPVRMLMVRPWTAGRCVPPDKNDLLKLIEMTMTRQTTDSGPVTIVCSDGARCCGLFCTVSNVILNLRIEDEIDVFHTVRQLQIRRPQFITDYEEYKSCYEIVKLFLDSSNIYANV